MYFHNRTICSDILYIDYKYKHYEDDHEYILNYRDTRGKKKAEKNCWLK